MGGGGKGGAKKQTIGYRYYMSIHMGLCRGPVDEIVQIKVGDLTAWPFPEGSSPQGEVLAELLAKIFAKSGLAKPNRRLTAAEGPGGSTVIAMDNGEVYESDTIPISTWRSTGDFRIDAPNLFGGDKKEGGVAGSVRVMMGFLDQVVPPWIKTRMGGRVPDFRGVTTLFFDGLLTSMNPYPKKWQFRVRRTERGWDGGLWRPNYVTIWMREGSIKAMNPAHIIYECMTNRDWGRGMSRDLLLESSWFETAKTLFNENLGLCLRYNRQSELSAFIQEVVDHIGGTIYPDRSTGKLCLGLLRGDYDPDDIPLFTYDTGLVEVEDNETATQEDLVNETIVKWFDPLAQEERTARVQNIASRQTLGAINSTTKSYAGVPTVDLALRLAQRDIKAGANALKRYKITLDRRAWRIVPGDVFRISAPERNIYNVVLRAGKVSEGGGTDGRIRVEAILDVFGLPATSFITEQVPEWAPVERGAEAASERVIREATYAELVAVLDTANLQLIPADVGMVATIVGRPSPSHQGYDLENNALGETEMTTGAGSFSPYVKSTAVLEPHTTVVPFVTSVDFGLVQIGRAVQIGSEIARLDDISLHEDGTGSITIARGCADTVPLTHPIGTTLFFAADEIGIDGREYARGETVNVRVLPYTSANKLDPALAPVDVLQITGRQGRPYPPGNVRVNGQPYSTTWNVAMQFLISWAHRDRIMQQDQLIDQRESSIGPEAGTTYRLRVYAGNTQTPVRTVQGITGTQFIYNATMAAADGVTSSVWFELESVRGGLASHTHYRFGGPATFAPGPTEPVVEVSDPRNTPFISNEFGRIPFFTTAFDTQSAFTSDNRYTVPSSGDYRFTLDVGFVGALTPMAPGTNWDLKIDNYTDPDEGPVAGQSSSGTFDGTSGGTLEVTIPLTAGDVISAYLRHDNASSISLGSAVLKIERLNS